MMSPNTHFKYRGTIILDSSALYSLMFEVRPEFRVDDYKKSRVKQPAPLKRPIHHYLGIVEYLSRNGFDIVIPDVVLAEVAGMDATGQSINELLNVPMQERGALYSSVVQSSLKRVCQSRYKHMCVARVGDATEDNSKFTGKMSPREYLSELNNIMSEALSTDGNKQAAKEAFDRLKYQSRGAGIADEAIEDYIALRIPENKRDKVFVLSNDRDAMEKITGKTHVNVMNMPAFLTALHENVVFPALGLKETLSTKDIITDCNRQQYLRTGHERKKIVEFDMQWDGHVAKQKPFSDTLKGIVTPTHQSRLLAEKGSSQGGSALPDISR